MAFIEINPTMWPGEAGLVALAALFTEFAKDATPEQKQLITQRFLEVTAPYHKLNVALAENVAHFIAQLLHIDVKDVQVTQAK